MWNEVRLAQYYANRQTEALGILLCDDLFKHIHISHTSQSPKSGALAPVDLARQRPRCLFETSVVWCPAV